MSDFYRPCGWSTLSHPRLLSRTETGMWAVCPLTSQHDAGVGVAGGRPRGTPLDGVSLCCVPEGHGHPCPASHSRTRQRNGYVVSKGRLSHVGRFGTIPAWSTAEVSLFLGSSHLAGRQGAGASQAEASAHHQGAAVRKARGIHSTLV